MINIQTDYLPAIVYHPEAGVHLRQLAPETILGKELLPGTLLVKITHTSICGSDHHFFDSSETARSKLIKNLPIGHELAGEVIDVGTGLERETWLGKKIAVESHVPKYRSDWQQKRWYDADIIRGGYAVIGYDALGGDPAPGAWTPFIVIPHHNAYIISDNVVQGTGGYPSLLEPNGNAVNTILLLSERLQAMNCDPEQARLVIFGLGVQGRMMMYLAGKRGIANIVGFDISEAAIANARKMGLETVILLDRNQDKQHIVAQINDSLQGQADVIIDSCGDLDDMDIGSQVIRARRRVFSFWLERPARQVPGTDISLHDFVFNQLRHQVSIAGNEFYYSGIVGRTAESWREIIKIIDEEPDGVFARILRSTITPIGSMDHFAAMLSSIHCANDLPKGKLVLTPFAGFA